MLLFRSHLVCLFIKFLDLEFFRANVSFQFLNLVVKYELKFFSLLDFLLQLANLDVFFIDCRLSGQILLVISRDISLNFLLLNHFVLKLILFLLQILCFVRSVQVLSREIAHEFCKLSFILESFLDIFSKYTTILVIDIDIVIPSGLFGLSPHCFNFHLHLF